MHEEDNPAWKKHAALFQSVLGDADRHEIGFPDLVRLLSNSLTQSALFPSEETAEKRVPQIAVFTYLCAPRRATERGLLTAAEFLYVFFLFNEYWPATGEVLNDVGQTSAINHRVEFIRGWLRVLDRDYGHRAVRFLDSFRTYHQSLIVEQSFNAKPGHPTFEEYVDKRRGRYQWVATSPYIDLWELVENIEVPGDRRPTVEALKELGVELTYLANDIGSMQRDGARKNYVQLMAMQSHDPTDLVAALEVTTSVYREKVREFKACAREFVPGRPGHSYVDMIAHVTDGNLKATAALAQRAGFGRYSHTARACLDSLVSDALLVV